MNKLAILCFAVSLLHSCTEPPTDLQIDVDSKVDSPEKIQFPSLDSLPVTANWYHVADSLPVIVLCHQARFNKYEYAGIAEKLNERGFNCLAIDQRSGGPIADQPNETTLAALEAGKPFDFLDAEQDMIAAVRYASERYDGPLILWGSSYSSTLALYLAIELDEVSAVVSFSPGNYMSEEKGSLIEKLSGFGKPAFITSSKREAESVSELLAEMTLGEDQIHFIPEGSGHHGSRALWNHQSDGEEYWAAINSFLGRIAVTAD